MRVSFDFDGVLSEKKFQRLAKKYLELGFEVRVVTARMAPKNGLAEDYPDIAEVLNGLKMANDAVIFTGYGMKAHRVRDFDIHIDDDMIEINEINQSPSKCIGLFYRSPIRITTKL